MPVDRDGQVYDGTGWKFLTPYGSTTYSYEEFYYPLPQPGDRWGPWITHPNPAEPDGRDCGPGRFHVMNRPSADYAPENWWIWYVQYRGIIGQSGEKTAVRELRLRRVSRKAFWRMIRLGWCRNVFLRRAPLYRADLWRADLRGTDLRRAVLFRATLCDANLRGAAFCGADLTEADLRGADLTEADLRWAVLNMANLRGANLTRADLRGASLYKTNLCEAELGFARLPDNWKNIAVYC